MTAPITRGPREVRRHLMAFMASRLPGALALAREAWGLTPEELPDPVAYDPYETQVLDVLPRLSLNVGRARDFRRRDYGAALSEQYEIRYTCRLYCWLKYVEDNPTQEMRDDYASVVTSVLLATPSLDGLGAYRVEETSLEVTYSDVSRVKGDRYVAGASVGFDLLHAESLRRVPLGSAERTEVGATVLSGHPGLD